MGGLGTKGNVTLQQRLGHRMKIVRGHAETVSKMIDEGKYCIDIINQSRAVQHALREIDNLLLENHLKTCVVDFVSKGKTKESIEEIMKIFRNGK